MEVNQSASSGMSESELSVTFTGDTGSADPTIIVTCADASLELNSSKVAAGLWTKSLPTGQWLVEYRSGQSVCVSSKKLRQVKCAKGFKGDEEGGCVEDNLCGNLTFHQRPALDGGSQTSDLRVSVSGGQAAKDIELVRTDAITEWGSKNLDKYVTMKTGSWQLQYSSGGQQCPVTGNLSRVTCNTPAYKDKDGYCVRVPKVTRSICKLVAVPPAHISADITLNLTLKSGSAPQDEEDFQKYVNKAQVKLVPATQSQATLQNVTQLSLNKTGQYSVQIESGSSVCELERRVEVRCPNDKQTDPVSGACMDRCQDKKVRTIEGACAFPAIKATIESDALQLKLEKSDPHLDMSSRLSSKVIQVAPKGDYKVPFDNYSYSLTAHDSKSGKSVDWVKLGAHTSNKKAWSFPIEFDPSGIEDSTSLNATLVFSATLANNDQRSAPVALSAPVELSTVLGCVPSLEKSTMLINGQPGPSVAITAGQEVDMKIQARDHEDKLIKASKGRYIDFTWRMPGCNNEECEKKKSTSFKPGEARPWFLKLSSLELSEPGDYEIWVSEVFGYTVTNQSAARSSFLTMPTSTHPYKIIVKSSRAKKIVAGVVGAVAVISLGGVFWYARKNQGKLGVRKSACTCQVTW